MKRIPNLSEKTFLKIFKMVPLNGIECVVKTPSGVLLTRRMQKPFYGYWHIPGTFIRYNEKLVDAAKRCARGELGIKISKMKYIGYYDCIKADPRGHYVGHIFLCRTRNKIKKFDKQGWEIGLFKKLPKKLPAHHRKILHKLGYR